MDFSDNANSCDTNKWRRSFAECTSKILKKFLKDN